MTESANPYRISRLWAEFVDPAMERAYRLHMQPLLARHLRVALWVWGCLLLAFGLQDLQALGMSDEFLILAGCRALQDRKSTRLNSSHVRISYAVFCLKKKKKTYTVDT